MENYVISKVIPMWTKMKENGKGNTIVYQTGYLWWKKRYGVSDMLEEYKNNSSVWGDYLNAVVMQIAFEQF